MYVVTVEFGIKPDTALAFRSAMLENAKASVTDELGCRQFDVCFDTEDPGKCFLYEVYDDRAAFEAHLAMAHFKSFDATVGPMLDSKLVKIWGLVQGSALP